MKHYKVSGMSCAACSLRVEKAVKSVNGVKNCAVSLLTGAMTVDGGDERLIFEAVKRAGYGISTAESGDTLGADDMRESKALMVRLIISAALLVVLMYISMGYVMWGFPLPVLFSERPLLIAIIEAVLAASVMIINKKFFVNGVKGAVRFSANMDTLVALGSGVSFIFSVYLLVKMSMEPMHAEHMLHELYFETAAMIPALITVGKSLEARAKGKTTNAIKELAELTPPMARVVRDGVEIQIPSTSVEIGDTFIVKAGEKVPVDGIVSNGSATVDESGLTGESIPVEKLHGSQVYAATQSTSGYIVCIAEKVGSDTAMAQVVKLVSDAVATKAPIAKAADRVAKFFVPSVLFLSLLTAAVWLFVNKSFGYAVARAVSVLVISCPCALGLATPVAIMVGSGIAAKQGILFKNAASLEASGRAEYTVFDKTGTLTYGKPSVTDIIPIDASRDELISFAASIEFKSEHPLSQAVMKYANECNATISESLNFRTIPGIGVYALIDGIESYAASFFFVQECGFVSQDVNNVYEELSDDGKTPLFFIKGDKLLGIIAVSDTVREEAKDVIAELRNMGIRSVMLTGDNERCAAAVASTLGTSEFVAGVLPGDKEREVKRLSKEGGVIMIGDGINDAPALTSADVGMAIGRGTDIAIESADVVLMNTSLESVTSAVKIGRATLRNIHENLFFAFLYNVICIPIAAGVLAPLGFELPPMLGALAMSLSSFSVVMNALRLNLNKKLKKYNKSTIYTVKEVLKLEKVLKIKGMMCPHCEARVKDALLAVDGVVEANVSHKKKQAVVKLSKDVDSEILKSSVEAAGYTVLNIT